jgi:hypothetical protein
MATEAEVQARLTAYLAAEDTVLNSAQSYKIGTRSLTRADLAEIRAEIARLENRLAVVKNSGQVPGSSVIFGGHLG